MSGLINNYADRMAAASAKQNRLLNYLREERWTTYPVLADRTGLAEKTIRNTISKMAKSNLVQVHQVAVPIGRAISVIGLTSNGLAACFDNAEEMTETRVYPLRKINPITMDHRIAIQRARITAEKAGWTDWTPEWQQGRKKNKHQSLPDAIATNTSGYRVALEIERTPKTVKRYSQILASHLIAIKRQQRYDLVLYLCPDEVIRKRVERLFRSVSSVRIDGRTIEIQPAHFRAFKFSTYQDFAK